jgi:uncharacterized protein (TIGR02588 family)
MSNNARSRARTPAEWTTLAVVVLILGTIVGLLIWYAVQPARDATFTVTVETSAITEREGRFYVPLRILNTGDQTAEDVMVRAELLREDEVVEEVELTVTFLAGGEEAEGVAVFGLDPRTGTIEAGVSSHLIP